MFNARSISNKLQELHDVMNSMVYDIIFITESWANKLIPDSLILAGFDYTLFRVDRHDRPGGGLCILTRSYLKCVKINCDTEIVETLCIDVINTGPFKYRFILCYRPPEFDQDAVTYPF